MADTMTIGRITQLGAEVTHGVAPGGGATHQLTDMTVQMDPAFKVTEIRGTGHRFLAEVVPDGMEATAGKLSGGVSYNALVYFLSACYGAATITTPSSAIAARQWKWTIPLTGSINPVSLDIEQGDGNDADQYLYTVCDSWGIDASRSAVASAGTLIGRATNKLTPVGSFTGMTGGATPLGIAPVLPKHWSVYFDTAFANLGATKLTRAFHAKFDHGSSFQPFFPLDSALPSYGGIADGEAQKFTMMIEMMRSVTVDPTASEQLWLVARAAQTRYCRLLAGGTGVSPLVDNLFQLNGSSGYSAGTVGFTYKGQTTSWAYNALGSAIQTAIQGLSTVGVGNVLVTPSGTAFNTNNTFTVQMVGALAQDQTAPTITTQPTGGTVTVTPVAIPYTLQLDMALQSMQPGGQKDFEGLRTREWSFNLVEDPALWGNALIITIVNQLAAL